MSFLLPLSFHRDPAGITLGKVEKASANKRALMQFGHNFPLLHEPGFVPKNIGKTCISAKFVCEMSVSSLFIDVADLITSQTRASAIAFQTTCVMNKVNDNFKSWSVLLCHIGRDVEFSPSTASLNSNAKQEAQILFGFNIIRHQQLNIPRN
jgi:hypothetical protein